MLLDSISDLSVEEVEELIQENPELSELVSVETTPAETAPQGGTNQTVDENTVVHTSQHASDKPADSNKPAEESTSPTTADMPNMPEKDKPVITNSGTGGDKPAPTPPATKPEKPIFTHSIWDELNISICSPLIHQTEKAAMSNWLSGLTPIMHSPSN